MVFKADKICDEAYEMEGNTRMLMLAADNIANAIQSLSVLDGYEDFIHKLKIREEAVRNSSADLHMLASALYSVTSRYKLSEDRLYAQADTSKYNNVRKCGETVMTEVVEKYGKLIK